MKITVDNSIFRSRFEDYNRVINGKNPNGNFTYSALDVLFDYYNELDQDCGTETELDVIGICCDWGEYNDKGDLFRDYGYLLESGTPSEAEQSTYFDELLDLIRDRTTLIEFEYSDDEDGYLVATF